MIRRNGIFFYGERSLLDGVIVGLFKEIEVRYIGVLVWYFRIWEVDGGRWGV